MTETAEAAGAPAPSLLEIEALVAGYTDVNVLHDVSVRVRPGEIVSIIGPNGAGKSTLIKAIAGLVRVRGGRVLFAGADITQRPTHEIVAMGVGYVPQLDNIFPNLTVEENLEMGAYITRDGIRERLDRIYTSFPVLAGVRRQRAAGLSGGQRQMLGLGRALMADPKLLMLDEPSAGLAPVVVGEIFANIREINEQGHTILLVEQNARRALAMADRAYVLDLGHNRFEGPGAELLHDPKVIELYLGGERRLEATEIKGDAEPVALNEQETGGGIPRPLSE